VTRIAIYPADLGGCGHYRLIWPARALQAQGVDIDLVLPNEPQERQLQAQWYEDDDQIEVVDVIAPDADIVVIQRPIDRHRVAAIEHLQAKGVRVVVEIDDDFDNVHPRNIAWPRLQPHLSAHRNRLWLHEACQQADMVIVSTPALADRYGSHGRVRVVRNRIPARYLEQTAEPHDGVVVGWSGSVATHPDDLQVMGGGLATALRATGAELAVVGTGKGVRKLTGIDHAPRSSGWRPIFEYPQALAQLDIGIVPLAMTPFNAAKSHLKGLEMSAVGVPFLASPTPEYERYCAEGAGTVVRKPRDWERALKRLIRNDRGEREDMAERAREVASGHTIQAHCGEFLAAWTAALDRHPVQEDSYA
jgi:glycosyltransferase involved in cell wall biosynthesis